MMRARWFAAGALSVALVAMVYERGVKHASPTPGHDARLGPGQSATPRDNALARGDAHALANATLDGSANATVNAGAPAAAQAESAAIQRAQELEREVARLRGILVAHNLSPETGAVASGQAHRRGLDDDGDTDLSPDEWRQLAQRGELRYAIPGTGGADPDHRIAHAAQELGLRENEATAVRELFHHALERLMGELRADYREAVGGDPGSLSLDALQSEIRDKTPGETIALVDYQLAQERGGLSPRQSARADAPPYERMMRALITYETGLEAELNPLVGAQDAHDLLHGDNAVGGHAYGRTGRIGDGGAH